MSHDAKRPMDVGYTSLQLEDARAFVGILSGDIGADDPNGALALGDGRVDVLDGDGRVVGWMVHDADDGWTFLPRIIGQAVDV